MKGEVVTLERKLAAVGKFGFTPDVDPWVNQDLDRPIVLPEEDWARYSKLRRALAFGPGPEMMYGLYAEIFWLRKIPPQGDQSAMDRETIGAIRSALEVEE